MTATLIATGKVAQGKVTLSAENVPTWEDGFVGMSLRTEDVSPFKEVWSKFDALVKKPSARGLIR